MHFKREGIPIFGGKAQNETKPDTRVFAKSTELCRFCFDRAKKKKKKHRIGKTGLGSRETLNRGRASN